MIRFVTGVGSTLCEAEIGESLPIGLATTFLLHLLRVNTLMAGLAEVAGLMFLGRSGAVGKSGVITIVEFVGTSHCGKESVSYARSLQLPIAMQDDLISLDAIVKGC